MSRGPWVIARRLEDGDVEFLGNEDEWTAILEQAAVMASEQVAQRMVRDLRADMRVVSYDTAQGWLVQGWLDGGEVGPPYNVPAQVASVRQQFADELDAAVRRVEDLAARGARAELLTAERLAELEACADVLALVAAEVRP